MVLVSPAAHLPLCGLVPLWPQISTSRGLGGSGSPILGLVPTRGANAETGQPGGVGPSPFSIFNFRFI